ncbi:MAG TPA: FtsX-like permease family protein [Fimbriimonas sp.]|nr:FtsX-like permease family protein [Fimbriimonas sp.]
MDLKISVIDAHLRNLRFQTGGESQTCVYNLKVPPVRLWLVLIALLASTLSFAAPTDDEIKATYKTILSQVKIERIRRDFDTIAAFGSRLAGSEGESRTFDYVEAQLKSLGLKNLRRDAFDIVVPDPASRGKLEVAGKAIDVFPLWPNLVRASTTDVRGPLIYGGDGSLEALKGKQLMGSVVLLEMRAGATWKNAAKLGAGAVVFLQPDELTRGDIETKFSAVPIDSPRFYLPLKQAARVLNAAKTQEIVHLTCRQDWLRRKSWNLSADVPGTQQGEPVELMAYADSISAVPGLAPGAEAISGIAGLLEAARVMKDRLRTRPIRFVLSGAHHLALQGAREYVLKKLEPTSAATFLTITLDLSSGNQGLGVYGRGWFYEARDESQEELKNVARMFRNHTERLAPVMGLNPPRLALVDAVNNSDSRTWKNNISGKFALDCEPMVNAGMNALTFLTVEDSRDRVDTPFDTVDHVNVANVHRQIQTLCAMLHHALNDTSDTVEQTDHKIPLQPARPSQMTLIGGFSVLTGQVFEYDAQKSFVPDIPVVDSLACALSQQKTMMGVRGDIITGTSDKAEYKLIGIPPTTTYWWGGKRATRLAAFHLDRVTGKVDYAPSFGFHGDFSYPIVFELKTADRTSPIVVFKCVAMNLYDVVDPQDLKAMEWVRILDQATMTNPPDFGEFMPPVDQRLSPEIEDAQVLFMSPGQRFILLGGGGPGDSRLILTNSTLQNEAGSGYLAPGAKPTGTRADITINGTFHELALNSAKDIVAINGTRLKQFAKYRIISAGVKETQAQAEEEIRLADEAYKARDWAEAERHARAAWGFALRAHPTIMSTANDVVNGVVFYLFLLIPFSYFLERLLIGNQLLTKQLMWAVGFFIGSFVLLRFIHPAFEIVSNPTMIFVAFVMGALSLIVVSFILGKFEASLKAVRQLESGVHEVDIKRSSVAMAAFNLGVSNMRRRKARTILTTLTLVVMTFIVLSFTSIVQEISLQEYPSDTPARYSGILIRNPGLEPLQASMYRQISNEFTGRGTVVRRATYYGADIGDTGVLTLQRADRVAEVRALLGFEPGEAEVLHPQEAIAYGRWFKPGEREVMILPTPLAQQLKVEPQDVGKAKVVYAGVEYTVIGIADPGSLRGMLDLDGDNVMPADFTLSRRQQQESASSTKAFRKFIRLDPGACFLVPTETAISLGADIRTIGVSFPQPQATRDALDKLMPRLRMNLYASVPKAQGLEVRQFSVLQSSQSSGLGLVIIQLLIAAVFVLNTMIASVYERTKEIGIFSSIGLAPNHIAMLFFAESLVYGILGAVIGYFLAQGTAKIIVATNTLQGLTLNFSSTSAVMSAVIVMAVVLLSTIYPARKASQIAAPAMNEEVFETEPDGDRWELPLPFSISATEAGPIIQFLGEWFSAYEEYTIGEFVTSGTSYGRDDSRLRSGGEAALAKQVAPAAATDTGNAISASPSPLTPLPRRGEGDHGSYFVETTTWLAPYDLGISQQVRLVAVPSKVAGVYALDLVLTRLAGDPDNWPVVNRRFLANLRKQFLTWRTLDKEKRARYEEAAKEPALAGATAE